MYYSVYSSDNSYTREDAVTQKWLGQVKYYFDDVFGGEDTASAPRLATIKNKAEIEKMLQAAGPSKEVDWSNLSIDFWGTDFDVSKSLSSYNEGDFIRKLDYIKKLLRQKYN